MFFVKWIQYQTKRPCEMSKQITPTSSPASKRSRTDDYHTKLVSEWEAVQEHVVRADVVDFSGMIATADVDTSYRLHKDALIEAGYAFGTYNTDRSLFEKLDRLVFQRVPADHMGRTVFDEAKNILSQINEGSRPREGSFSMLVMMSTEYIVPVANLVHLLAHPHASPDDLNLFWELTDRLWCFAHPIYRLHSGYLDETCEKITTRLAQLKTATTHQ